MFYKLLSFFTLFLTFASASLDMKKIESFEADFTQNIRSLSGKVIEYKGKVFIQNNGKVLWKYKTPIEKNVYIINDFAIVDEPELEQAIFTQLQDKIDVVELLKQAKKITDNTYLASINSTDYTIETSQEEKIKLIKYKDKLDNSIEIIFANTLTNHKIDDDVFKFEAPDYYDIIRK